MAVKPVPTWAPGDNFAAVTKSDTVDIPNIDSRGAKIYVGVGGDVTLDSAQGDTAVEFKNVASGSWMPVLAKRVRTATTATNIVAVW